MAHAERYRLLGRLGAGGMAEVLEAEILGASGFVRRVAVKRMLSSAAEDPSFVRMFLDEARIASHLHHANIVGVIDYGVVDGAPFQVLELVDGLDARTLLRRAPDGRLPIEIVLYLGVQVGHALAAAHDARDVAGNPLGIVHRDVSPANVLISWDGDVKLADFGIAFAKNRSEKTETGMMKGTLVFMSPEQATGGGVDARSDLFSLGCVLHMLLTGQSPLAGDGFHRFLRTAQLDLDASLPDDIRAILQRAVAYDRSERYADAGQMTEALGQALARRAMRDPRRLLVEHLAPLRAAKRPPGKLDDLFAVDLVLSGDKTTTDGPARTAVIERVSETARRDETRRLPVEPPAAAVQRSRAPLVITVAAFGLIMLGVAGFGASRWARAAADTASSTTTVAASVPAPSSVPSAVPTTSTSTSELVVAPPPAPSSVAPRLASRPAATKPPSVAATATDPSCSSTVFLSCPSAPRAPVMIDGKVSAHHHGEFVDLPCGHHRVTFQTEAPRTVATDLTAIYTRTAPLEVRCVGP